MPCAIAPACPLVPPPMTLTVTSNLRCVLVTRSGARAAISRTRRPRYASGSLSLTVTRPSPGVRRTRAIAFLRRPVPWFSVSANLQISFCVEGDDLRLLRPVAMVRAGIDAEPFQHVGAERVALEHAADGGLDRKRGVELLRPLQRAAAQPARVAGVARVLLRLHLAASHLHLGGVDDDHVVTTVQVGREGRLVLAAQDRGHT